jgi:hypothetical protein
MFIRYFYVTSTAAFLVVVFASIALAGPAVLIVPAAVDGYVFKTQGCHRSCAPGPVIGWHRHGLLCRPVACVPYAVYPRRCFVDWAGVWRSR